MEAEEEETWGQAKRRGKTEGRGEEACAIRSCLCLSVCLFSHSRYQFALRTVTVEQREKEACQVGHTQREMERDKTGTKRHGGVQEEPRWGSYGCRHTEDPQHARRNQGDAPAISHINQMVVQTCLLARCRQSLLLKRSKLMREGSHLQEGCESCLLGWLHPAEQSPHTDKEIHTFRADKQNRASPRLTGSDGCGEVSMRSAVKIHAGTQTNKQTNTFHINLWPLTQSGTLQLPGHRNRAMMSRS